jgi:3-oxoacyl-[acyl-carrier protein] reductase
VTGAASGIGLATATRLVAEGAKVFVADLDVDAADRAVAALHAENRDLIAVRLDVTDRGSWQEAIRCVGERLHIVVNCAGFVRDRSFLKLTDADWDAVIAVHLKGSFLGCQEAVPVIKQSGGGAIVNISSDARHGAFGQANYSAAKAGIVGLTRTIAVEQAKHGIRANAVAPGPTETPMLADVPQHVKDGWLGAIPLGRLGKPEEVASVIAFLASDDAAYITGHVVPVDGGATHP